MSHEFKTEDALVGQLHRLIRVAVKILAVLMVVVIFFTVADAVYMIVRDLSRPPVGLMDMSDILTLFGAFLAVLIAIEIFANITLYLRDDIIHVNLVLATALMAMARKVIVFDFSTLDYPFVAATGVVILGLGVTYWLLIREDRLTRKAQTDR